MRQLEEENLRLKKLVADLSLDKAMLQFCDQLLGFTQADHHLLVRVNFGFKAGDARQRVNERGFQKNELTKSTVRCLKVSQQTHATKLVFIFHVMIAYADVLVIHTVRLHKELVKEY
ncbi:hypothetical protein GCM10011328_13790 [Hafnia psychrotolerans]|uniref:Transposase n=1 Tax=Hafnia psychrotolerans TaxID=1477018 RepID=A0ABQ1GAR4_9GAMM|nr:hypothetical protein GCM10011328_13790 [Hafnia psychrotolerans]